MKRALKILHTLGSVGLMGGMAACLVLAFVARSRAPGEAAALHGGIDMLMRLVSKVMPSHASHAGTIQACEKSLRKLGTEHLDCYLLHWPGDHPLEQTIGAFEKLVEAGKIRAWGVSNFDASELQEALDIAGPGKIACNQVLYHLMQRDIENEVVPWCAKNDVAVVGYTPFGRSKFPPSGPRGKLLEVIAKKHGATPRQVALAFLTRISGTFAIPKASQVTHVRDNAAAQTLKLDESELADIDAAYPRPAHRPGAGVPML